MSETQKAPPKRLYRSNKDKVIAGVCGGLGGYLNIDPVIVRIVWLALFFFGGTGLLAYLIAWILVPEVESEENDPGKVERKIDGTKIVGIVLIVLAFVWLGSSFGWYYFDFISWSWLVPLALVALGIALLLRPKVHEAANRQPGEEAQVVEAEVIPEPEPEVVDESTDQPAEEAGQTEDTESDDASGSEEDEDQSRPFDRWPLRRSRRNRVFGGVCGGLGQYYNTDPTVVRLGFALVATVSFGLGLIAYLIMWVAVSEEEE